MKFILAVRVTDFRSVARADLGPFGDLTPLVGSNGSGKSNFLRTLSLFFNDELEPGEAFDLRRDFREPGRKAKLRVAVEVDLDFGAFDALRDEYEESLEQLAEGHHVITFRKEWTLHPVTRDPVVQLWAGPLPDQLEVVTPEKSPHAVRLLRAVRFRYVPNHVHPGRVLMSEEDTIRKILFDRLRQKKVLSEAEMKRIQGEAQELMQPVRTAMKQAASEIGDVKLATPTDWREIAWAFGLQLQATQSRPFDATYHGSGIQSVLAYQILHMVDTTFSGSFGWRKGAVWAIEEPESFLHARLQSELARSFASYSNSETLQIILTTHSSAFLGAADEGVVVELDESGRSQFRLLPRRDVVRAAFATGATPYAHPLHTGPPKPLLLVEGDTDRDLIVRAYSHARMGCPYEVLCLKDFDNRLKGGSEVAPWLKHQRDAVEARPETSPVIVVLDWEEKDSAVEAIDSSLRGHATSRCVRWPADLSNPHLSQNWVGIERFLSTGFIEHCQEELNLPLLAPARPDRVAWKYGVDKRSLESAKPAMHRELARRNRASDIEPIMNALGWLSGLISDAPPLL